MIFRIVSKCDEIIKTAQLIKGLEPASAYAAPRRGWGSVSSVHRPHAVELMTVLMNE